MNRALYVGLEAPNRTDVEVIHLPLIKVAPKLDLESCFARINEATHIIVTSKTTVALAKEPFQKAKKIFVSVGSATTTYLQAIGITHILTAKNECQEGIIELLEERALQNPIFFWPHSSLSRPIINNYCRQKNYPLIECHLYDTHFVTPEKSVDLTTIHEIHFTSPSCVQAFFTHFGPPPAHITLHTKGPVTKACLDTLLKL